MMNEYSNATLLVWLAWIHLAMIGLPIVGIMIEEAVDGWIKHEHKIQQKPSRRTPILLRPQTV